MRRQMVKQETGAVWYKGQAVRVVDTFYTDGLWAALVNYRNREDATTRSLLVPMSQLVCSPTPTEWN